MCDTKRCNACGENKPLEDFTIDNGRPKDRSDKCRECTRLRKPALPWSPELTGETKVCRVCNEEKDLAYFKKRKGRSYDREPRCNECAKKGLTIDNGVFKDGKKKCSCCQEYKALTEFNKNRSASNGVSSICRPCQSIKSKEYRDRLPDEVRKERKRKDYLKNRQARLDNVKEWVEKNKDRVRQNRREKEKNYKVTHPLTYLKRNISTRIRVAFNKKSNIGWKKAKLTISTIQCDMQFFREHIEKQFLSWMGWDNYGDKCENVEPNCSWDLDHIIPLNYAKTEEELYALCHWSYFQPLCSYENRFIKRDTVPYVTNLELKITTNI